MKKDDLFKSKIFRLLLPFIGIVIAIALWRNGYQFGKWLSTIIN